MTVLSKKDLLWNIELNEAPLVAGSPDLETALQPNGIDLTVDSVTYFTSAGGVYREGKTLAQAGALVPDERGIWYLRSSGAYLVRFSETINLPDDTMAYLLPRSSLLRCGVTLETAVWDAGYHGIGQALLVVHNPMGFELEWRARVAQMVFHELTGSTEGYNGAYQHEQLQPLDPKMNAVIASLGENLNKWVLSY